MALAIDTYFGFFARSVFTAIGSSVSAQTGRPVQLAAVTLAATNTLKLRWSEVETVLIPRLAEPADPPFCLALAPADVAALTRLAAGKLSLQTLLEQAVGAAVEPFNFVAKNRNRLRSLLFSRNVTGLTASHLGGALRYTMATGAFRGGGGAAFSLRLLLAAGGRDRIEERAAQPAAQRALYTINAGTYVCRPQWQQPPPPPGAERGAGLNEDAMNGWLQSFLGRNDGAMANRLFKRPAGLQCALIKSEAARKMLGGDPVAVVRLQINGEAALELFVLVSLKVKRLLLQLSKSGQEKFLGDFFRALFSESAQVWERFGESPVRWSVAALRDIPSDALDAVEGRLKGGGFLLRQAARLDDGFLEWALAVPPHTWRWLLLLTAKGMGLGAEGAPDRAAIFAATGWGNGSIPWSTLIRHLSARDQTECARLIAQAFAERPQAVLGAFTQALPQEAQAAWLAAMPADLRDRTQAHKPEPGEAELLLPRLTGALLRLNREGRVPEGKLAAWLTLYAEQHWMRRQTLADALLPLRHLIYGMDRASLSRLMVDAKDALLVEMMALAEFPVVDQLRRSVPPGFGLRLLEDVAVKRAKINAYTAQEAQFALYRLAAQGMEQGRYMIRATPAERLRQVLRALDEGS
jgi:hypothetical protein